MPNLIEQQDLLKGLPDNRLATLLQNPVGDIPPFLVAAEAQRRQAIRQQFSGEANNESVVDSLTRQLAKVPQNINAPMDMPPKMPQPPQTPQAMGLAALQNQMPQPEQQMADGGMVRRFDQGGKVQPWWVLPDLSGIIPDTAEWLKPKVQSFADFMTTSYDQLPSWSSEPEKPDPRNVANITPGQLGEYNTMNRLDMERAARASVKDPGKKDTSTENQKKEPQHSANPSQEGTPDDIRRQVEELYATQEPSGYDKAQRWFAMAEQFLDPEKTTLQSLAGAGRAFAEESSALKEAQRQQELERKKAMLQLDISDRDYKRQQAASAAEMQRDAYKFYAEQGKGSVEAISELMKQTAREKADYIKSAYPVDGLSVDGKPPQPDPNDPNIQTFNQQLAEYQTMLRAAMGQRANALKGYGSLTGTDPSVTIFTGDGLAKFGG